MKNKAVARAIVCLFFSAPAYAQIKCVNAEGRTVYQETPCLKGERESKLTPPRPGPRPAYSPSGTREPNPAIEGPPESSEMLALYRRWIDAEKLASVTPRISLAAPVKALQDMAREVDTISPSGCLSQAHQSLRALLRATAEGYLTFMRKDGLGSLLFQFIDRPARISEFEHHLSLAGCKPVQ